MPAKCRSVRIMRCLCTHGMEADNDNTGVTPACLAACMCSNVVLNNMQSLTLSLRYLQHRNA